MLHIYIYIYIYDISRLRVKPHTASIPSSEILSLAINNASHSLPKLTIFRAAKKQKQQLLILLTFCYRHDLTNVSAVTLSFVERHSHSVTQR